VDTVVDTEGAVEQRGVEIGKQSDVEIVVTANLFLACWNCCHIPQ